MLKDFIYLTNHLLMYWVTCFPIGILLLAFVGFGAPQVICLITFKALLFKAPQIPCSSSSSTDVYGCSTRSHQRVASCAAVCVPPTVTLTTVLWGLLWYTDSHSFSGTVLSLSQPSLHIYADMEPKTFAAFQNSLPMDAKRWWQPSFIVALLEFFHLAVLYSAEKNNRIHMISNSSASHTLTLWLRPHHFKLNMLSSFIRLTAQWQQLPAPGQTRLSHPVLIRNLSTFQLVAHVYHFFRLLAYVFFIEV